MDFAGVGPEAAGTAVLTERRLAGILAGVAASRLGWGVGWGVALAGIEAPDTDTDLVVSLTGDLVSVGNPDPFLLTSRLLCDEGRCSVFGSVDADTLELR